MARFKREIKAAGRLDHTNIVRAYDAREVDGTHFLVMELVTGVDLADLVRLLGPLPIAEACELIRQAASGLDYAYRQGLVHRDIKPSNLIVSDAGVVKILDMGLARFRTLQPTGSDVTIAGQALGTPDYMAPEQVQDSHSADIRADLYSLGCTLYFLLAGQAPFGGPAYRTVYDKMSAHVHDSITPVTQFRSEVPDSLAKVLDRVLAKNPEDRFSTPAELAEALLPLAATSDLRALVAEAQGRSPTPRPRSDATRKKPLCDTTHPHKRMWIIAGVLGALALALAVLVVTIGNRPGHDGDAIAEPAPPFSGDESPDDRELAGWIVMSWTL